MCASLQTDQQFALVPMHTPQSLEILRDLFAILIKRHFDPCYWRMKKKKVFSLGRANKACMKMSRLVKTTMWSWTRWEKCSTQSPPPLNKLFSLMEGYLSFDWYSSIPWLWKGSSHDFLAAALHLFLTSKPFLYRFWPAGFNKPFPKYFTWSTEAMVLAHSGCPPFQSVCLIGGQQCSIHRLHAWWTCEGAHKPVIYTFHMVNVHTR